MPFSKFIVFPIFVAFQAALMMLIAGKFPGSFAEIGGPGLLTWVAFQAWAMYFLGGCTVKMAGKSIIGYILGIVASIAIFTLFGKFSSLGTLALPVAVFVVVIPVMCLEKVEIANFIPALFVGSGVFFALCTMYGAVAQPESMGMADYMKIAVAEMVACVTGLAFGWCTVTFRTKYEAAVMPAEAEETKEAA